MKLKRSKRREKKHARWHLVNMSICDMCEINKFICEYEKYYYQLDKEEWGIYRELFINKLPNPIGDNN